MKLSNIKTFFDKYGFFLLLAVCGLMIAAAYLISSLKPKITTIDEYIAQNGEILGAQAQGEGVERLDDLASLSPTAQPKKTFATASPEPADITFFWPVQGTIVQMFTADELTFNPTLKHYATHEGIDLGLTEGTKILAAADGTVLSAYEDAAYGCVIVLEHKSGYKSLYGGVSSLKLIKEGDAVKAGQLLGYAAGEVPGENYLGAHLHFEISKDNIGIDPLELLE